MIQKKTNCQHSKNQIQIKCSFYSNRGNSIKNNVGKILVRESILPNFDFFVFSLLSLSVCSIKIYCLHFKMAKLNSKKQKYYLFYKGKKFGRIDSGSWRINRRSTRSRRRKSIHHHHHHHRRRSDRLPTAVSKQFNKIKVTCKWIYRRLSLFAILTIHGRKNRKYRGKTANFILNNA